MKVLGVHIGHDSSAALVVDGKIMADVAEERFNRIKHYAGLPVKAIEYCLESNGLTIDDIDIIAVPSAMSMKRLNYLFGLKGDRAEKLTTARKLLNLSKKALRNTAEQPPLYIKNFPIAESTAIEHVEHHLAHAASAYYTGGLEDKQLIVTMDGAGDGVSVALWRGEGKTITPLKKFDTTASLGWFYSNVTEALGWIHGDGEGKTMGLDPYGSTEKTKGVLDGFYPRFKDGDLVEPHDFGVSSVWNDNGANQFHFDEANDIHELVKKFGKEDIAAEAQRVLEEQAFEIVYPWLEKENTRNLSCAGGIFMNVKLNQRIWESGKVDHHYAYPNSGDSGLALGAALHSYYKACPEAPLVRIEDIYWGTEYTEEEIEETLKLRHLKYTRVEDIEAYAAGLLVDNKIIGWFQGRMESGPRALGNRSILMSPLRPENKDVINARVKFREAFRPFCPSLLWEKKEDYLENVRDEFFMITSFTCKEEKRAKIPAVVHADQTMRPQTVKKEFNPRFWKLIKEFGDKTGEYILLNTSFNVMGEPIVNQPRDAVRCFYDNGLDYLIIGNFVLSKEQPN